MRVSVCITTFNGEEFIQNQIDSILCQLSENDELIVSDDGSTDQTCGIIASYNDNRIKLFKHQAPGLYKQKPINYRITRNFENALKHAGGDIIFLADQDDQWEKNKVSEILAIFREEQVNLVLHDAMVVDKEMKVQSGSYFRVIRSRPGIIHNLVKNSYLGCCMAFDRKILNRSLPFPEHLIAHDMWIGLIGEKYGKVRFLGKPLIRYRRHDLTATTSGKSSGNSILYKLEYRIQFLIQFLGRVYFNPKKH